MDPYPRFGTSEGTDRDIENRGCRRFDSSWACLEGGVEPEAGLGLGLGLGLQLGLGLGVGLG